MASNRPARIASLLRDLISELMAFEVKDPRVCRATVTDVEITGDLREARIFVMLPKDAKERTETLAGLKSASGFIRREVGRRGRLRNTPELLFCADDSFEYGLRVEAKLRELDIPEAADDPEPND